MAYIPKSTIAGLAGGLVWSDDFTASRDEKGKWTGSESFTCKLTEATRLIPNTGTPCQLPGWNFLKLSGIKLSNISGDLALVTCEYGGFQEGDAPDEESSEKTYELGIVTNEEPLESHPRYKDIDDEEKLIIQNVKNGKYELANKEEPYIYKNVANPDDTEDYEISSNEGKELIDFLMLGVESYLAPAQIWRSTFTSKKLPKAAILNDVGKITSAEGAPAVSDGKNWLFLGCNVSQQSKIFTITYEWQFGNWNEDIYG